jgi:recombinase
VAAARVLRGESLRSIAMDWNERGVKIVGGGTWQGSMIRRVLMSPRIAGLKEHRGEIVSQAKWPAIIDRATHDRLVGLLGDESRRPANYGRSRVHPLAGLLYCGSCGGHLVTYLQPRQGRGYGCRKDENPVCAGARPHRRRTFGGLHRGLRDRPVAEPSRPEDRPVRRRPDGAHWQDHQRDGAVAGAEERGAADEATRRGRRQDVSRGDGGDRRGT